MAEQAQDGADGAASLHKLLHLMCTASEKAARIARACRSDEALLRMLVEQKRDKVVHGAAFQDFKTLADVLIQETIVKEIGDAFPTMREAIMGEEKPYFKTRAGHVARIQVCERQDDTRRILERALGLEDEGDKEKSGRSKGEAEKKEALVGYGVREGAETRSESAAGPEVAEKKGAGSVGDDEQTQMLRYAARALASIVHDTVPCPAELTLFEGSFDPASTGIWIDPLDSTNGFISGRSRLTEADRPVLASEALLAVSVLIGAFDTRTGLPFVGVVNQPFYAPAAPPPSSRPPMRRSQTLLGEGVNDLFAGRCVWGVASGELRHWGSSVQDLSPAIRPSKPLVVHSNKEARRVLELLQDSYTLKGAPGAGYKLLCVIDGTADGFVLSSASTFKWDTCGPHAILRAQGAVLRGFHDAAELTYHCPVESDSTDRLFANTRGLVVARSPELYAALQEQLVTVRLSSPSPSHAT